ncbi:hypothetical protein EV683_14014 [Crenobacter luteus]|nr:hypothetical protein EV683_14014 [Crenobacter luteus]
MTFAAPLGCATPQPAADYSYKDARTVLPDPPPRGASSCVARAKRDPVRGRGGRVGGVDNRDHSQCPDDRNRAGLLCQARQRVATWCPCR